MIISLIAAVDDAGGIGKDNHLPWHLPADLKHFRRLTTGHHMIMGRKTHESIGRLLPDRTSIILTKDLSCQVEGCLIAHSLPEAIQLAKSRGEDEVFIIGGGQVFKQAIPFADRIYLTVVNAHFPADIFFPPLDPAHWVEIESSCHDADDQNPYSYTFKIYAPVSQNANYILK